MPKRFMEDWEREKANHGSERAIVIRKELEKLSPFQYEPLSSDVESGFIPGLHKKPAEFKLDYAVLHKGKRIALLDVTASDYTLKGSNVMPVDEYKGVLIKDSSVPVFILYEMEKESLPLSERCVWIHGEDVVKCRVHLDHWGKLRHNYHTNKGDWHRGLKTLIEEFKKLITL
jgi:hypothetical protein